MEYDEKKLYEEIKNLDPKEVVTKIDFHNKKIEYNLNLIKLHENIEHLTGEELVRAYIVSKLVCEMGYKNKYSVHLEKRFSIGRKTKKGAKADILVYDGNNPFLFFETKSPDKYEDEMGASISDQLFNVAPLVNAGKNTLQYLIYYTVFINGESELIEKVVSIDFKKYELYESWEEDSAPNLMLIPKDYGVITKPVFIKNSDLDLRTSITKEELERIRGNIHNILWAGGKYHIELFFNLMGILLAKIYDEKETEENEAYQFQVFYKNDESEDPNDVFERINKLYLTALKEYLDFSEDEIKKVRDIVFDPAQVKYTVEILQEISLTNAEYDVLGDFFEKIVRNEFKQSKAQYLTHFNIVNFIIRVLNIEDLALGLINKDKRLPYIIDPSCGSGSFLIEGMKLITSYVLMNKNKLKKSSSVNEFFDMMFPSSRSNAWAAKYIYGIENSIDLSTSAKVNMVGHGDGSANIEAKDALIGFEDYTKDLLQVSKKSLVYPKPVNEQFDIVISNPPFSITIDRDTAKKLPDSFIWGDDIKKSLDKSKKKKEVNTEHLFIERWYQLLRPGGRLGVVLPESVFDVTNNMHIRLFLYKYFWIKAVVSLPDLAFQPYTPTKTSLLFAEKKTHDEVKEYNKLWSKYAKEYKKLRTRITELYRIRKVSADENKYRDELAELINELINDFDENDFDMSFSELKKKYMEEIKISNPPWWIFGKVSEKLNYPMEMSVVDEIGYKRGLRGEYERPNQLFHTDESGEIIIDMKDNNYVLNYLRRNLKWKN